MRLGIRLQKAKIVQDLNNKVVVVVGPSQVGKKSLVIDIAKDFVSYKYLNYNQTADRQIIERKSWLNNTDLLILDEIHKMPNWHAYVQNLCDTKPLEMKILCVVGAKIATKTSHGSRIALHHLLPFTLFETKAIKLNKTLKDLLDRGGFPEALFAENDKYLDNWRYSYLNKLLREDILDFAKITNTKIVGYLIELLRAKVGISISYTALAKELKISTNTVIKYIEMLEDLFVIFRVMPFAENINRAIQKTPKIYFYDTGLVSGDKAKRLENLAANSLQQYCYFKQDYLRQDYRLQYLRDKDNREVDFVITFNNTVSNLIEIKVADNNIDKNLKFFSRKYGFNAKQLVLNIGHEYQEQNVEVLALEKYLTDLPLHH